MPNNIRVTKESVDFCGFLAHCKSNDPMSVPYLYTRAVMPSLPADVEVCLTILRRPWGLVGGVRSLQEYDADCIIYECRFITSKPPVDAYLNTRYMLALFDIVVMEGYWSVTQVMRLFEDLEERWERDKEKPVESPKEPPELKESYTERP